jgi:hypothetical protein
MAKYFGNIGFAEYKETAPDVWREVITEKPYYGDILKNYRQLDNSGEVNDDVTISNRFSIISDPYAQENFHAIRYIMFMGIKWKVTNVEVEYPRLILNVGGEYHGEDPREPQ